MIKLDFRAHNKKLSAGSSSHLVNTAVEHLCVELDGKVV